MFRLLLLSYLINSDKQSTTYNSGTKLNYKSGIIFSSGGKILNALAVQHVIPNCPINATAAIRSFNPKHSSAILKDLSLID